MYRNPKKLWPIPYRTPTGRMFLEGGMYWVFSRIGNKKSALRRYFILKVHVTHRRLKKHKNKKHTAGFKKGFFVNPESVPLAIFLYFSSKYRYETARKGYRKINMNPTPGNYTDSSVYNNTIRTSLRHK
jgi:hypothetical protein